MNTDLKLDAQVYRSYYIGEDTKWNNLKKVEVVDFGDDYSIYVYDVGFQPPFWDVQDLGAVPFWKAGKPKGLEGAEMILQEKNVNVEEWKEENQVFLHECNAIVRPEIRTSIEQLYGYDESETQVIPASVASQAIQELAKFNGHSAKVRTLFLDRGELCSFATSAYIMFRKPSSYGHWGIVAKGSPDNVAVLLKSEAGFTCLLYDQLAQTNIIEGRVVHVEIDFTTNENSFVLTADGLSQKESQYGT